jgi:hypothetical protein
MNNPHKLSNWFLFAAVFFIGFSFALYTNHAWEDWYITYRASKNLALGNGLVFTVGERVHSFTSPLGTLIPALLSYLTGNRSDELVLWLFRAINCSLLGLSAVMLLQMARTLQLRLFPTMLVTGLFTVDAKIIDFSINGQETALMMVFLVATLYCLMVPTQRVSLNLGLAWGGLMWTRPDSFVYIGALALGYLAFNPVTPMTRTRHELLKLFFTAGLVTTAVYLPWTVWTWYYYGTPVPHTVIAKGLMSDKLGNNLFMQLIRFPYNTIFGASSVVTTFLPPNFIFGGWPGKLADTYGVLALLCTYCWFLPFVSPLGRAVSFVCFAGHFYLTSVAAGFFPWYLPSVTLLSIIVLGQLSQTVELKGNNGLARYWMYAFRCCAVIVFVGSLLMTLATGHEMKLQQKIIETGNRNQIGLWLKQHAASPKDTVFLECLGYIGFYSQLKMLDFPGLSSPEVVAARRQLKTNKFDKLIKVLKPDWLVLRPSEIEDIMDVAPLLLSVEYKPVKIFDVSEKIKSYPLIFGREYLQHDETFVVFRKLFAFSRK